MIVSRRISTVLSLVASLSLASCGGGGGSSTPPVHANPTPTPTPTPAGSAAAYTCPTSDVTGSVARSSRGSNGESVRHVSLQHRARSTQPLSSMLAVTYDRTMLSRSAASIASRETAAGATRTRAIDFPHTGLTTHILSVPTSQVAAMTATLRAQPGVKSVALTGYPPLCINDHDAIFSQRPLFRRLRRDVGSVSRGRDDPRTVGHARDRFRVCVRV